MDSATLHPLTGPQWQDAIALAGCQSATLSRSEASRVEYYQWHMRERARLGYQLRRMPAQTVSSDANR